MKLLNLFILLLIISSCSKQSEKEEIKTFLNGGISTSFIINNQNENFEKNLRNRLDFLTHKESFEYDLSKEKNIYTIKLPFILSKSKINNLLFSRGEVFIKKDDSIYFDSNSFRKEKFNINEFPFQRLNLNFKEEFIETFRNFTTKYNNQNIDIYVDSTLIMNPKIRNTIANGKLMVSTLNSDAFNSDILNAVFNCQYENEVFKTIEQKILLKSDNKLVEIPEKYNDLYNQLWNFISIRGLTIIKNNTNLESKKELETSLKIGMIRNNDFYGFLANSNVKSISDLNEIFFHFQGYLSQYDYQNLNKKIDSLRL
ncbi:hypothetical protein SAMN05444411_1413 [Lutibacter oricola]|uniref:Lipoprotein n=1 Tax=Lutibacter oricola TaxID=762486 RepID=A0A1H3HIK7_9FLAO|nr:hypothetical protein [Lutibacter oricola]SDY15190.1 hypothetical protein SAMN05444411_1413 [Lutibacter oricola]